jgi:hypothetical protein
VTASPALLISDLGRPLRFFNMLRMFKVTSPMNVGSWLLAAGGGAIALAAANAWTGLFPSASRVARPAAALLGMPLSTYTAALVANTAVPAWHEARGILPFVFGSGAAASAGAVAVATTPRRHAGAARRLTVAAGAAELLLTEAMKRRLGGLKDAYEDGAPRTYANLARAGIAAGAALVAARGSGSRAAARAGGALVAAGALAGRWSVFRAGFRSAADPKQVVRPQRERIERGDTRGAARREPALPA